MELGSILIIVMIVLGASFLQAGTGFGFSIMATPFLLLIFEPHHAIQINIILSIFLSIMMMPKIYKEINWILLKRLLFGGLLGLPIGVVIYAFMDVHWLKILISILILLITLLLVFNFKFQQSKQRDIIAGVISGLLTTSIGMPGPPLLIYFSGIGADKTTLRSTTLSFYMFIYTASLFMQIAVSGQSDQFVWNISIYSIPIVIIGTMAGQLLFKRLNRRMFQKITYTLLFLTGSYLLISSIFL